MKKILRVLGMIMWFGAGLFMLLFWIGAMGDWLGFLGTVLALILSPGLVIFPIIYWIVEGVFPINYFAIWGLGIVGLIISGLCSSKESI
jgi:hypothetical protein